MPRTRGSGTGRAAPCFGLRHGPVARSWAFTARALFINGIGHGAKFVALRTEATTEGPHGLGRSLARHAPDGTRLVGVRQCAPGEEEARARYAATQGEQPWAADVDDPAPLVRGRDHAA